MEKLNLEKEINRKDLLRKGAERTCEDYIKFVENFDSRDVTIRQVLQTFEGDPNVEIWLLDKFGEENLYMEKLLLTTYRSSHEISHNEKNKILDILYVLKNLLTFGEIVAGMTTEIELTKSAFGIRYCANRKDNQSIMIYRYTFLMGEYRFGEGYKIEDIRMFVKDFKSEKLLHISVEDVDGTGIVRK